MVLLLMQTVRNAVPDSHVNCLCVPVDEIETLLADFPNTRAIIDHCGFCNCSDLQSTEWRRLLSLAKYPQVCLLLGWMRQTCKFKCTNLLIY